MCLASLIMSDLMPALIDFKTTAPEVSSSRPAPERLLAGDPEHGVRNYFADATGQFFAGIWQSTPGKWRVRYSENEFCHLTSGRVCIEDEQGRSWSFAAGDTFVVPAGFAGTWQVLEPTSKLYAIFEPASK